VRCTRPRRWAGERAQASILTALPQATQAAAPCRARRAPAVALTELRRASWMRPPQGRACFPPSKVGKGDPGGWHAAPCVAPLRPAPLRPAAARSAPLDDCSFHSCCSSLDERLGNFRPRPLGAAPGCSARRTLSEEPPLLGRPSALGAQAPAPAFSPMGAVLHGDGCPRRTRQTRPGGLEYAREPRQVPTGLPWLGS